MKTSLLILTTVFAALFTSNLLASEEIEFEQQIIGFGSGTGMGAGASTGSVSNIADSLSSQSWVSGSGNQSFGGGFDVQQSIGSGPLSTNASASTGSGPVINNATGASFQIK